MRVYSNVNMHMNTYARAKELGPQTSNVNVVYRKAQLAPDMVTHNN